MECVAFGLVPATRSVFGVRRFISALQVAREFYLRLCIAAITGMAPGGVTTFERKRRQAARRVVSTAPSACGWLRGTSRTSPGPPRRWRRPVWLRSTSARGRGFAAYLSACGGQPFIARVAGYARGASLTTFGFVTTVPRYLPKASNSLTFVRGACRACCAPRKWLCRPTFALPVLAARTPPAGALACAPGSGTLPPALVVRRVNGIAALFVRRVNGVADRPMLRLY